MKILLDSCISGSLSQPLTELGHDVVWTGDWGEDPGDDEILALAHQQGRVLVTLDKDFGTLAVLYNRHHAGILRLVNLSINEQVAVCQQVLTQYADELINKAIITAERDRLRIRRPG